MSRAFLDTNVLVYGVDLDEPVKRERSIRLQCALADEAVISTQVLSEFAEVSLRQLGKVLTTADVRAELRLIASHSHVVCPTPDLVDLAIQGVERFCFAFYDAQIWAAARIAGCSVVLSEDFTDGLEADGVRFVDPFREGFDPATVLG